MLKAAKILGVIGKVFSIILLVVMAIYTVIALFASAILIDVIKEASAGSDPIPDSVLAIFPTVLAIVFILIDVVAVLSIVFTSKGAKLAANAKSKKEVITTSILMILFGTTPAQVAAILMLAAPADMYANR